MRRLLAGNADGKAVSLENQARGHSFDCSARNPAQDMPRDDTAPIHPPSLAGGPARDFAAASHQLKVMDLGSGGGLPGIPLKICLPFIDLTLVESTKKKARFLETALRELGIEGVEVIDRHSREIEKDPVHQGKYDIVVARAVAELKDLVELVFPFIKLGGRLIAYKGAKAEEEIAEAEKTLKKLYGIVEDTRDIDALEGKSGKRITVIKKNRESF